MKPELEQQVTSFLEATKQAGSNAASFLSEQAPVYVNEVVAWEFWKSAIIAGGAVALLISCLALIRYSFKQMYREPDWFGGIVVGCIFGVISCAAIATGTLKAVKAKVAPRVVIVEHVSKLMGR